MTQIGTWSAESAPQLCDRKIVLFMFRLDPKKGIILLMRAVGELVKRREDFVIGVAGRASVAMS